MSRSRTMTQLVLGRGGPPPRLFRLAADAWLYDLPLKSKLRKVWGHE